MIETRDYFAVRADKSQDIKYYNSRFNFSGGRSLYSPDMNVKLPEHWHEDLEFLYVLDGQMDFNVNGKSFVLKAGEAIFVNSKRIHSNGSPKDSYCVFYYTLVHPSVFVISPYLEQKYVNPLLGPNSVDYLLMSDEEWSREINQEIYDLFETGDKETMEIHLAETCLKFFRLWYEHHKPNETISYATSAYIDTFKAMVTYINENYAEKITLEDIAGAGNIGKTLCAKIFKTFTTKNPGEYLLNYRIDKSMDLLKASSLSVTDIAYQTGFCSASHYTKTFREMIGCTPNHFRNGK